MGRKPLEFKWFYDKLRHHYEGVSNIKVGEAYFGILIEDDDQFRFIEVTNNFVAPEEMWNPNGSIKPVRNKLILRKLNRIAGENSNKITKGLLQN